jgi:rubredoxin
MKKISANLPKFKCPFCNYIFSEEHEGDLGILNMYGFSKDTKIRPSDKELSSIELKNLIVCPNCDKYFGRDLKSTRF